MTNNDHEAAAKRILSSSESLKLTVSGISVEVMVRKDADGRLGLSFATAGPPRHVQGAVISEAVARGEAARGGVRVGDVLVAVDDQVVRDADHAIMLFKAS